MTYVTPGAQYEAALQVAVRHEGDFVVAGAGESMSPYWRPGTCLVVHPTSAFMLKRGMAVVYVNRDGRPVAHLLVARTGGGWVAAGLNNANDDEDLVTDENLVGVIRCAFAAEMPVASAGTAGTGVPVNAFGRVNLSAF